MKKIAVAIVVLTVVGAGGLYFFLLRGQEYELRLTQQQIQDRLDQIFPVTKRHLLLFEITYRNPKVILMEGSDRIRFPADAELSNFATNDGQKFGGSCEVVAGLRYDPDRHEFHLVDSVIENIDFVGLPVALSPKAEGALKAVAEDILATRPVYTQRATDLNKTAARMVLKKVIVENGDLVITLGL